MDVFFFDLLFFLGFAPLSELSGGMEDEATAFAASLEHSKVWCNFSVLHDLQANLFRLQFSPYLPCSAADVQT